MFCERIMQKGQFINCLNFIQFIISKLLKPVSDNKECLKSRKDRI